MPLYFAVQVWYAFLIFVLCLVSSQNAASPNLTISFNATGTTKFSHLVVDENEGTVFVGAVNNLYQLSPELKLTATYATSPNKSYLMKCSSSDYSSDAIEKLNNHNKIILIDYEKSRLIACGNFKGICTFHDIRNISNVVTSSCESVVANNEKESAVAFIAATDSKNTSTLAFYVGVSNTNHSTHQIPAIASRSLKDGILFKIQSTSISIDPQHRNAVFIKYVYGFNHGPYSYFLTIQKISTMGAFSYVSKIIRICNKNDNSYVEIPIKCTDKQNKNKTYNLVQAALIKKPGELPDSISNAFQGPVLFTIFSQSTRHNSNEPSNHTALCEYSLSTIDYKLIQNAVSCLTGTGFQSSKFIPPNKNCTKVKSATIDSDLCWLNENTLLGGTEPVESSSVLKLDTMLSAINVESTGKYAVAFVGTQTGSLKKIVFDGTNNLKQPVSDVEIDKGSPVISLQFDKKKENLYVMTEHKLFKMPVQDCQAHQTDHNNCLDSDDPYCGWCLPQNQCTLIGECLEAKDDPLLWIPYNYHSIISITKIKPGSAPLQEITHLTLTVNNLPSFKDDLSCTFTISDKVLVTNGTRIADNKINCPTPEKGLIQIPKEHGTIKGTISIRTTNFTDLGHKTFKFYDCEAYTTCSSCVVSKCCWFVKENTCVYKQTLNCFDQTLGNSSIHAARDCPSTKLTLNETIPTSDGTAESIGLALIVICLMIFLVPVSFLLFRMFLKNSMKKKIQNRIDELELYVAAECREAFAELQTEISDSRVSGMPESLPFWDYRTYVMNVLFSNIADHSNILIDKPELTSKRKELRLFSQLLANKSFLLLFIRTLENDESFSMNDRVYVASMIMIALQNEMEYCTDVIKALLASLIGKSAKRPSQPKLLFRRGGTIVEKMLPAWFTFLLHKFLLQCAGKPLFTLYKSIKQQLYKGPIDEITSEARYSLNENKLIRQQIDYNSITVYVSVPRQTAADTGLGSAVENVPVKMLDCDTISQAKEKAVNGIYFSINYSLRPKASELNLISMTESCCTILYDTDFSSEIEGEWKRRNTLHHYKIDNGSMLQLILISKDSNMEPAPISTNNNERRPGCDNLKSTIMHCASPKICRARYKSIPDIDGYYKEWHLVKPNQSFDHHSCHDGNMVSEVYLTRLLSTKGTLQKFVNNLFEIILSQTRQNDCFPIAIKYMFDFLDDQASVHGITDSDVVHSWKNNCLPLRFWVNLIKNPNFLFDICKSDIIDACLSVVAQAFMDSCSISDNRLGKDSPTAKLLYAKDIPFYKEWVKKYYADIKAMPAVSRDDMSAILGKESQLHCMDFNTNAAVYELYTYAVKYKEKLLAVLREDQSSQKYNLANKLVEALNMNATAVDSDLV